MRSAAVDIGTNTARIFVAQSSGTGLPLEALRRLAVVTRLGRGVDAARALSSESVRRTLSALADFESVARGFDAPIVDAVATSAVRDALDRDAFLGAAAEVLGVRPRVIGGAEEAALTFRGVASRVASDGPILAIDLGGGSTEIVFGRDSPEYAVSIDIGSVRLTERCLGRLPAPLAAIERARVEVDRLFAAVAVPSLPKTAVGVGGTFTSLAAILLDLELYEPHRVHHSRFGAEAFDELVESLSPLTLQETTALGSLDPARAPVLLGGAIVVAGALAATGVGEVMISEADILDGMILAAVGP